MMFRDLWALPNGIPDRNDIVWLSHLSNVLPSTSTNPFEGA